MRKITLLILMMLAVVYSSTSQDIQFDPDDETTNGPWLGFMNVSNLPPPDDDGAFQFPSGWGVGDLIVDRPGDGTATLRPNRVGDPDPYWQGGPPPGMLRGNKIMDANFYKQSLDLNGNAFSFNGSVDFNDLNNTGLGSYDFTVIAFIKVFAPDFSSVLDEDTIDLRTTSGDFSLVMDATIYPDTGDPLTTANIQYGFQFIGPNIGVDPMWDAGYNALGGITIGPNQTLSVEQFELNKIKAFPNPTQDIWTIKAKSNIDSIELFDVLGKQIMSLNPNSVSFNIDSSRLSNGIYIARVNAGEKTSTLKLVKE